MVKKKTATRKKAAGKSAAGKAAKTKPVESEQATSVPDILTIDQAADYLQLSRATVYRLINESDIPVKRIGERYRFSRRKLLEWIEK
jgi:excisionase family DNA binding protein